MTPLVCALKNSEKSLPRPLAPAPQKVWKKSRKSPKSLEKVRSLRHDNKFLDNKMFTFKILLSWRFARKIAFWTIFLSAPLPNPPPPWKTQILFLLSSRFLWKKSRKCLFGTFSRLFPDFLGPRGRRPRNTLFKLFWDFGPGGPERLL